MNDLRNFFSIPIKKFENNHDLFYEIFSKFKVYNRLFFRS